MNYSPGSIHSPGDFGLHLRSARKARGLTQSQAAAIAGVGVRLWNEAENGKRAQVGLETALRMLRAVAIEIGVVDPDGIDRGTTASPPPTVDYKPIAAPDAAT